MFWRIYFWTFTALSALNALSAALRPAALAITDWVDLAVFTPMALFAVWSQAFDKWLVHPNVWRGVLFGAVFWKSISLGISVPQLLARVMDLNAKAGVAAAGLLVAERDITGIVRRQRQRDPRYLGLHRVDRVGHRLDGEMADIVHPTEPCLECIQAADGLVFTAIERELSYRFRARNGERYRRAFEALGLAVFAASVRGSGRRRGSVLMAKEIAARRARRW